MLAGFSGGHTEAGVVWQWPIVSVAWFHDYSAMQRAAATRFSAMTDLGPLSQETVLVFPVAWPHGQQVRVSTPAALSAFASSSIYALRTDPLFKSLACLPACQTPCSPMHRPAPMHKSHATAPHLQEAQRPENATTESGRGGLRLSLIIAEAPLFPATFPTATPARKQHFATVVPNQLRFPRRSHPQALSQLSLTVSRLNLPKPNQPVFGPGATNARTKPNATVRQPRVPAALFARFSPISS